MNIRAVKGKIKSFGNVKKITNAMQMVSAVKMKKAQAAAQEAKPYQEFLDRAINRMSSNIDKQHSVLLQVKTQNAKKKLVILVTSNKGLCGSFNFNVLRFLLQNHKTQEIDFVTVGKKGSQMAASMRKNVLADFSSNAPITSVSAVFDYILDAYMKGTYASVSVVYNRFISSLKSEPVEEQLLPFSMKAEKQSEKEAQLAREYIIEPNPAEMIEALLKNYIEEKIRFAIMQNEAGEHSARMIAMKNATDNAGELIGSLTQLSNKLRQQKITSELLDMVTAKESVESS